MSIYGENKPRSLIEQKKLQWAKEREELARLSVPWGKTYKLEKGSLRALSKFSNSEVSLNREENYANRNLPPINKNKNEKVSRANYDRYEVEGDTSGYASDSAKESTPEYYKNSGKQQDCQIWSNWNNRSSESEASSSRDERPKWGDRGLGVGHLWEPHEINENYLKTVEPPGWMQRGLRRDKEMLVDSHSPESGEVLDRPFTGESSNTNMHLMKTHLRGQNVQLEPVELAERERKRQKALELQNAIKQQLEERERKRKEDREKKLREEAEEESRIRRETEIERLRVEEEQKLIHEKKEREKKRNEAMQEALENAEKQAKLEKNKQRRMKSDVLNLQQEPVKEIKPVKSASPVISSPRTTPHVCPSKSVSPIINTFTTQADNNTLLEHPIPPKEPEISKEEYRNSPRDRTDNHLQISDNVVGDNLALVLQSPYESLQGLQLAFLVPTMNLSNTLPLAVPLPVATDRTTITENRVLTPSLYRGRRNCRESSTQTDSSHFNQDNKVENYRREEKYGKDEKYGREEQFGSLDRRRDSNRSDKKERRLRSEDRSKEHRSERPKWGVNRPPTRYLKQSEKDPVYQKRKLRQKTRETKVYEDKNNNYSQSSDDSVPETPDHRMHRGQNYNRNVWHKNERLFSQNISVYQTEIVPLELDRQGRVYVKDRTDFSEIHSDRSYIKQKYREQTPEMQTERTYVKQKHRNPTSELVQVSPRSESRKEKLNERNERRKISDRHDSDKTDNEEMLDKLNNLRHGLLLKQQQWDNDAGSSRTRSAIEFPNVHENP